MEDDQPNRAPKDTAFIFAGGDETPVDVTVIEVRRGLVVAADSGLDHAERLGVIPDVIIGDMDSVTPEALQRARDAGVEILSHPPDKEATDLELAFDTVVERGFSRAIVVGGAGGRLSHLLGNATLLGAVPYQFIEIQWWMGDTTVLVADPRRDATITGSPGDLVSLVPLGRVDAVTTEGLEWKLDADHLTPGTSRGISNRLVGDSASVSVGSGVMLVVIEPGYA